MTNETWKLLDDLFREHPTLVAGGVSYKEIDRHFQTFDFSLSDSYREFIHRFGGAIVGPFSVYGIGASKLMGNDEDSSVKITHRFRKDGWPGVENWLVVSMDHSGNPVGMDKEGKIWISDHDNGCIDLLADDLEGYIHEWCLDEDK